MNDIWEEKNLIKAEKNSLNNNEFVQRDITKDIKKDSTENPCNDTGKENLMKGIVYKATCLVNNKVYIGVTNRTIEIRIKEHIKLSNKTNPRYLFNKAIKKYGKDNFKFEIIDSYSSFDDRDSKEINYINIYNSFYMNNMGYNMTLGGDGSRGHIKSKESIEKIKTARKNQIFSLETRELWSSQRKGRRLSDETKKRMSVSMVESGCHKKTEAHKEKLRLANLGKKHSQESKLKMSKSTKGRINKKFVSEEHLKLIRDIYKNMGVNKLVKELCNRGIFIGRKVIIGRLVEMGIYNENSKFRKNQYK